MIDISCILENFCHSFICILIYECKNFRSQMSSMLMESASQKSINLVHFLVGKDNLICPPPPTHTHTHTTLGRIPCILVFFYVELCADCDSVYDSRLTKYSCFVASRRKFQTFFIELYWCTETGISFFQKCRHNLSLPQPPPASTIEHKWEEIRKWTLSKLKFCSWLIDSRKKKFLFCQFSSWPVNGVVC